MSDEACSWTSPEGLKIFSTAVPIEISLVELRTRITEGLLVGRVQEALARKRRNGMFFRFHVKCNAA